MKSILIGWVETNDLANSFIKFLGVYWHIWYNPSWVNNSFSIWNDADDSSIILQTFIKILWFVNLQHKPASSRNIKVQIKNCTHKPWPMRLRHETQEWISGFFGMERLTALAIDIISISLLIIAVKISLELSVDNVQSKNKKKFRRQKSSTIRL